MSGHSKWANIKHRKAKQDSVRGKVFTKIGKELMIAVKDGGADPEVNFRLKGVVQKARENNIPQDNIQRIIDKASGNLAGVNYEEIVYEGYGPGGAAVLINIMTDSRNRTAGEIRHLFSKNGGNLGETGCVAWMFDHKGLIVINKEDMTKDEDEIMIAALEGGAEDVRVEEDSLEIISQPDELENVKQALVQLGIKCDLAELTMLPQTTIELTGDEAKKMLRLMDALEDHDDVQGVWANFDIDDSFEMD
ncbi:MAG: YebC/PmpR family DNA-binding transcriptional regulator [Carboxydocellales bacterium]